MGSDRCVPIYYGKYICDGCGLPGGESVPELVEDCCSYGSVGSYRASGKDEERERSVVICEGGNYAGAGEYIRCFE